MAEKRVTIENAKGEKMVGILHDTGSEVAMPAPSSASGTTETYWEAPQHTTKASLSRKHGTCILQHCQLQLSSNTQESKDAAAYQDRVRAVSICYSD